VIALSSAETVERYLDALNAHDVEAIERVVADELEFVTPVESLDKPTFLAFMRGLFDGLPDFRFDHGNLNERGDVASVDLRMSGTHTSTLELPLPRLKPQPATGTRVVLPEQRFDYTVRDGKIVRIEGEPVPHSGVIGLLEQIGVRLPPLWLMRFVARLRRRFRRA